MACTAAAACGEEDRDATRFRPQVSSGCSMRLPVRLALSTALLAVCALSLAAARPSQPRDRRLESGLVQEDSRNEIS